MPFHAKFLELSARVRNWGRWGADDQLGTLNLIDVAARLRGTTCVTDGRAFSLALPLSSNGPQIGATPGRINPVMSMVSVNQGFDPGGVAFNDDLVTMALQAATHWDALSHATYGDVMWNGYPASLVNGQGAGKCGIDHVKTIVSRGVLLDLPRSKGLDRLPFGYPITPQDLDAACELGKVTIQPGDIVLVRTGHIKHLLEGDKQAYAGFSGAAGLTMDTAAWFRSADVAAVATDNYALEVLPWVDEVVLPVHGLHLVDMGLTQGQNWVMEELADDCASDGRYCFLLSASPEPFVNGCGSPVNPVALK